LEKKNSSLLKLISTVIYFKLSIFQKHHAEERVFKSQKSKSQGKAVQVNEQFYENPAGVCTL